MTVNLEVRNCFGEMRAVLGPLPWPWALPRRDDVIRYGSPSRSANVEHVRYDLTTGEVVIVCELL